MGKELYNKSDYDFELSENFYSNLYYNWRKSSYVFTKFSVFDNQLTLGKQQFLRDYFMTMIYNRNNKSMFPDDYIIYKSDYFIKKLYSSSHWYIDGTFIYPNGFRWLIVILYYDEILQKRFPGLFTLINNKNENGYIYLLKKISDIIIIGKTKVLKLNSFTVDFEVGLIYSLRKTFKILNVWDVISFKRNS